MTINPNSFVRFFIGIFLVTIIFFAYQAYQQIMILKQQRRQLIHNYSDPNVESNSYDLMLEEDLRQRKRNRYRITKIKADIKRINLNQKVYNAPFLQKYGNITYIIVIQVHSNVYLLKQLIASLKTSHSISEALLIFSHDVFDTKINDVIRTVNFARYMQIFYPYTVQLHPYVYPGVEYTNQDGENKDKSKKRDPYAAQKKLHWWWQVNQVFDNLKVTKNHTDSILFLEGDNYVTEDFLVVLKLLEHVREVHCPVCEIISLGAHKPEIGQYHNRTAVVSLEIWGKNLTNVGIAFDRAIWYLIKGWSRDFCGYNDYTWENSLKHIGSQHMDINFYFTDIAAPRVFRIEECRKENRSCKLEDRVEEMKIFTQVIKDSLYPSLMVLRIVKSQDYVVDSLGSFDDARDYELCMYFTNNRAWY